MQAQTLIKLDQPIQGNKVHISGPGIDPRLAQVSVKDGIITLNNIGFPMQKP